MKIVTLETKNSYKPLTHKATADDPNAIPDVVVSSIGHWRREEYDKCVLKTRCDMSEQLSEYDKTFIRQQSYVETPDEDILRDTAEYVITCVILVKT